MTSSSEPSTHSPWSYSEAYEQLYLTMAFLSQNESSFDSKTYEELTRKVKLRIGHPSLQSVMGLHEKRILSLSQRLAPPKTLMDGLSIEASLTESCLDELKPDIPYPSRRSSKRGSGSQLQKRGFKEEAFTDASKHPSLFQSAITAQYPIPEYCELPYQQKLHQLCQLGLDSGWFELTLNEMKDDSLKEDDTPKKAAVSHYFSSISLSEFNDALEYSSICDQYSFKRDLSAYKEGLWSDIGWNGFMLLAISARSPLFFTFLLQYIQTLPEGIKPPEKTQHYNPFVESQIITAETQSLHLSTFEKFTEQLEFLIKYCTYKSFGPGLAVLCPFFNLFQHFKSASFDYDQRSNIVSTCAIYLCYEKNRFEAEVSMDDPEDEIAEAKQWNDEIHRSRLHALEIVIPLSDLHQRQESTQYTALMAAAETGFDQAISLLLPHSSTTAKPLRGPRSTQGFNALMIAIHHNHLESVKLLIPSSPVHHCVAATNRKTPLSLAIKTGSFEMVELVCRHLETVYDAGEFTKSGQFRNTLSLAAELGYFHLFPLLNHPCHYLSEHHDSEIGYSAFQFSFDHLDKDLQKLAEFQKNLLDLEKENPDPLDPEFLNLQKKMNEQQQRCSDFKAAIKKLIQSSLPHLKYYFDTSALLHDCLTFDFFEEAELIWQKNLPLRRHVTHPLNKEGELNEKVTRIYNPLIVASSKGLKLWISRLSENPSLQLGLHSDSILHHLLAHGHWEDALTYDKPEHFNRLNEFLISPLEEAFLFCYKTLRKNNYHHKDKSIMEQHPDYVHLTQSIDVMTRHALLHLDSDFNASKIIALALDLFWDDLAELIYQSHPKVVHVRYFERAHRAGDPHSSYTSLGWQSVYRDQPVWFQRFSEARFSNLRSLYTYPDLHLHPNASSFEQQLQSKKVDPFSLVHHIEPDALDQYEMNLTQIRVFLEPIFSHDSIHILKSLFDQPDDHPFFSGLSFYLKSSFIFCDSLHQDSERCQRYLLNQGYHIPSKWHGSTEVRGRQLSPLIRFCIDSDAADSAEFLSRIWRPEIAHDVDSHGDNALTMAVYNSSSQKLPMVKWLYQTGAYSLSHRNYFNSTIFDAFQELFGYKDCVPSEARELQEVLIYLLSELNEADFLKQHELFKEQKMDFKIQKKNEPDFVLNADNLFKISLAYREQRALDAVTAHLQLETSNTEQPVRKRNRL